jgi:hypothetical protein
MTEIGPSQRCCLAELLADLSPVTDLARSYALWCGILDIGEHRWRGNPVAEV